MSDVVVEQPPTSPADENANRAEKWKGALALIAAIILGVAAVLTSWSAFRESLVGDGVLKGYSEQQALISEANDAYGQSDAERSLEEQFFLQYAIQTAQGNTEAAAYLEQTMSPEMWDAVSWWVQQPDGGPVSPFVAENPYYANLPSQVLLTQGSDLMAQADAKRVEAEEANQTSDRFALANVFFAVVLFLAGIATLLSRFKVQAGILILSVVILAIGIFFLVTTPTWASIS